MEALAGGPAVPEAEATGGEGTAGKDDGETPGAAGSERRTKDLS